MPPRITQQSHRPRAFTQDDGWHLCQHLACVAAQLNGVKRHRSMKSSSRDQQLGLASPLNYAAIQSGKTKTPLRRRCRAGCKPHRLPRGKGREFVLDILFLSAAEPQPNHFSELSAVSNQRSALAHCTPPSFVLEPKIAIAPGSGVN